MTELKIYKLLTYLLAIPNAFIALITLLGLFAAIFNPFLFIVMILFTGVVLYAIASFIFLQKGIVNNTKCKLRLKRNLRTTSILAILFCVMCLMNCFTLIFNSLAIEIVLDNFFNDTKNSLPPMVTRDLLKQYILGCTYFLAIYTALLLLHILMTYKFAKMYSNIFVDKISTQS